MGEKKNKGDKKAKELLEDNNPQSLSKKKGKDKKVKKQETATENGVDCDEKIVDEVEQNESKKKKSKHKKQSESHEEKASLDETSHKKSKKRHKKEVEMANGALSVKQKRDDSDQNNMDVVENGESKKKRRKHQNETESQEEKMLVDEASNKKSKKERKKEAEKTNGALSPNATSNSNDIEKGNRKKHKKEKKLKDENEKSDTKFEDNSLSVTVTKKGKRKHQDVSTQEDGESPAAKKSKKEKKRKSKEDSSLGVVDTSILKQAQTNLGLPMADELEKETLAEKSGSADGVMEKKKKKDKKPKETKIETPNEKSRNERAVEYLRLWNSNKKAWKFNKMMQVQLLKIMYDKSLLSDEDFEILLLYLDGMKGLGREKTKEGAGKLLKDDKEDAEAASEEKEERARQIYQILS